MQSSTQRISLMIAIALGLSGCGSKPSTPTGPLSSSRTPHVVALTAPDSIGSGSLRLTISWWMACYEDFAVTTQWSDDTLIVTPAAQNQRHCPQCTFPDDCPPSGGLVSTTVDIGAVPWRRVRIVARDAFGYDLSLWVQGGAIPTVSLFEHRIEIDRYGQPVSDVRVGMTIPMPPWDTLAVACTDVGGATTLRPVCAFLPATFNLTLCGPDGSHNLTLQGLPARCGVPLRTVFHADW
jgi:hypothetical protein